MSTLISTLSCLPAKLPLNKSSRAAVLEFVWDDVDHELKSKLKLFVEEVEGGVNELSASKSVKDMNIGFAAIVVNGELFVSSLDPKPKSMFIALEVAVRCGTGSSKRESTAGSNVVRAVQSMPSLICGTGCVGENVEGDEIVL